MKLVKLFTNHVCCATDRILVTSFLNSQSMSSINILFSFFSMQEAAVCLHVSSVIISVEDNCIFSLVSSVREANTNGKPRLPDAATCSFISSLAFVSH